MMLQCLGAVRGFSFFFLFSSQEVHNIESELKEGLRRGLGYEVIRAQHEHTGA